MGRQGQFSSFKMVFGLSNYPTTYNAAVFYGKRDIPLNECKIGDVPAWLLRRNMSPKAMISCFSRTYHYWNQKWMLPKRGSAAGTYHILFGLSLWFYVNMYPNYL